MSVTFKNNSMKKILYLLFFISSMALAQRQDSIPMTTEQAIVFMSHQMKASHKEFKTGFHLSLLGIASCAVGAAVDADSRDAFLLGGGIMGFIGYILMIDSHRLIGNAGRLELTPNGMIVKLTKKKKQTP